MDSGDITELLQAWSAGDSSAIDRLAPLVYGELHKLAHHYLRRERNSHTLNSTALVHEVYLKLVRQEGADWHNRGHFFAVSGKIIRRVLVDHARASQRGKRGGGAVRVAINEDIDAADERSEQLIALDDALQTLEKLDRQQSQVVELRYFTGLSIEETAEVLGISKATVNRDWVTARAWLLREIARG